MAIGADPEGSMPESCNPEYGYSAWQRIELIIFLIVVLAYGLSAYQRNFVWSDDITLWSDVVKKSPGKDRAYNEIGMWYYERQMVGYAIPYFEKSISLNPTGRAHNNLGLCFLGLNWNDRAIEEFKKAINRSPFTAMYHVNLGIAYMQMGLHDLGSQEMQLGIEMKRQNIR
jgi:tetratricopeptide (TPR) repeat protein